MAGGGSDYPSMLSSRSAADCTSNRHGLQYCFDVYNICQPESSGYSDAMRAMMTNPTSSDALLILLPNNQIASRPARSEAQSPRRSKRPGRMKIRSDSRRLVAARILTFVVACNHHPSLQQLVQEKCHLLTLHRCLLQYHVFTIINMNTILFSFACLKDHRLWRHHTTKTFLRIETVFGKTFASPWQLWQAL